MLFHCFCVFCLMHFLRSCFRKCVTLRKTIRLSWIRPSEKLEMTSLVLIFYHFAEAFFAFLLSLHSKVCVIACANVYNVLYSLGKQKEC